MSTTAGQKGAAWRIHKKGYPPVTLQKETIDVPTPRGDELLIQVKSAALNPVDWKLASYLPSFLQKFPRTMGSDAAGIVLSHGPSVSPEDAARFPVGSRVFGIVTAKDLIMGKNNGTLATHAVIPTGRLARLPDELSFDQGASLPLVGMTALRCASYAKKGDKVLIVGGSTSVGLLLIQMLKHIGASYIVATASGEKKKIVQEKGANAVIDYRVQDVAQTLKKEHGSQDQQFDAVLDTIGDHKLFRTCPTFLKPKGVYFRVGGSAVVPGLSLLSLLGFLANAISMFLPWFLGGVPRRTLAGELEPETLPELAEKYVHKGVLQTTIDSVFAFDDVKQAYERIMTDRALGKVIVHVED